jgi:CRISPR/Cas system CSM-associated protein Csm5 (group 7 of RAMP superfamily)
MSYEKNVERRTISLRAVTPIHIKGKNVDYGQGFVRRNNYTAYAINHMKLCKYLLAKGRFEVYLEEVDRLISRRKFKEFDFQKFLKDHNLYDIDKPETHRELIDAGVFNGIVQSTNDKQFVRDGMQRPFVPGSSIKGFIRIACIYEYFKQISFADWKKYEDEIKKYDRKLTESFRSVFVTDSCELDVFKLKNEAVSIVSRNIRNEMLLPQAKDGEARVVELFGKIKLETHDRKYYDIDESLIKQYSLKTGRIVSSFTLNKKGKVVVGIIVNDEGLIERQVPKKVVSLKFKDKEELECFNGEAVFDVVLNKNHPNIPFSDIPQLLKVLDSFSQKIWELEMKYLSEITEDVNTVTDVKEFYSQPRNANARLGFGTGLISKTTDGILEEVVLNELVNAYFTPIKEPPHIRPKSRRYITFDNNAISPLGWVKLELMS